MEQQALMAHIESLLFVSGEPLTMDRLATTLEVTEEALTEAVVGLAEKHRNDALSGLMVLQNNNEVLLATKPAYASSVEALTKSALQETLSKAALEVLAIVAYRAPVSRSEIDMIRGVNCSFTLRNLLLRDLITREGNPSESRGYLYRPTARFLQVLGMETVRELPEYETLSQDERLRLVLEQEGAESEEKKSE